VCHCGGTIKFATDYGVPPAAKRLEKQVLPRMTHLPDCVIQAGMDTDVF